MRHSRKAVMAERYKLYMKKNIFNGRYLVRNIQIFVCAVLVIALVAGAVILSCFNKDEDVVAASASAGVKEALFGNSEEEKKVTKKHNTEEVATTESKEEYVADNTEATSEENTSSDIATANKEEDTVQTETQQEEKSEFEGKCIANVDETLNIRKEPSAEAEFMGSMNRGAIAKVESTEGEWTKIKSGDVEGYVLSEYILTGEDAEKLAKDYVTLKGTVLEDGVNIRAEKSTDSQIIIVLDKDDTITVLENPKEEDSKEENTSDVKDVKDAAQTEEETSEVTTQSTETKTSEVSTENTEASTEMKTSEASTEEGASEVSTEDETSENVTEQTTVEQNEEQETATEKEDAIIWISVALEDGTTGYVSADFVKVESLYELAISAEELERQALEAEAARKAAEEEAARQAAAAEAAKQAAAQTSNSNAGNTSNTTNTSNTNSDSYEGATTKPVTATESGECIGTFTITAYCGCKKCSGGSQKTASGTTPTEGRTIAADTSILPFGTKVVIGGVVYTVEDRGSGVNGNHIDIFFATHAKALAFGRKSMKVYKY